MHDLRFALGCRMEFKVGVDDPDRRERRPNRDLQRQTPHAARHAGMRPRQQVSGTCSTGSRDTACCRSDGFCPLRRPSQPPDETPDGGPASNAATERFDRLPPSRLAKPADNFLKAEHVASRINFRVETIRARSTTPSQPLPH